jgi:hypothetical protein
LEEEGLLECNLGALPDTRDLFEQFGDVLLDERPVLLRSAQYRGFRGNSGRDPHTYLVQLVDQICCALTVLNATRPWRALDLYLAFVSRPAVSQWLARHPDPDDSPLVVVGLDRKTYVNTAPPAPPAERPLKHPWRPDGAAFKALVRARKLLEHEPVEGLDGFYSAKLRAELDHMMEAAADAAARLDNAGVGAVVREQ